MSKRLSILCPCCGKVLWTYDDSPQTPCYLCGYPEQLVLGTDQLCDYVDNNELDKFWSLCSELRDKYLDKTNPAFSQEWFEKREEDDQRSIEEDKEREQKRLEYERKQAQEEARYVPRCPTCGSPNVFNRGNGAGKTVYGLMVHKQYVCNNCGYEW